MGLSAVWKSAPFGSQRPLEVSDLWNLPSRASEYSRRISPPRSPRRPLPGIQDFFNRKGLASERGERKRAFFVLQREYRAMAARPDSTR